MDQAVVLTWHQFSQNLQQAAEVMRGRQHFTDVTLAAEDRQIEAHRFILASSSSFFLNLLYKNPHSNPLIYLSGIKFRDLVSILDFMYRGQVRIEQARLQSFLAVAEELGIKGLAEENKQTEDSQTEPEPEPEPELEPEPEPEHQEVECSGNDPESMTTTEKNSDFTLTSENASLEQKSEDNPMESYEKEEETEDDLVLNLSEPRNEVEEDLNDAIDVETICSQDSTDHNSTSTEKTSTDQESRRTVETSTVQELDSSRNSLTILADIELQTITGTRSMVEIPEDVINFSVKRSSSSVEFEAGLSNTEDISLFPDSDTSRDMRLRSPDNSGYGKVTKQSTKRAEKSSITVSVERPSSGRGRGKRPRSGNLEKPRVGRHYTRSVERPSSRSGRGKRPSSRTSENFSSPSKRLSVEPTPKRQRTNLNSKLDSTPSSAPTTPTRKVLKSTNITQKKVAKESSKKKSPISLELGLGVENDNPNTQLSKESGAKEKEKNVVAVPVNNEGSENDDLMDENEWIELKNNTRVADVVNLMLTNMKRESMWNCRICHLNFPVKRIGWMHVAKRHVIDKLANI